MSNPAQYSDLKTRMLSALVMAAIAGVSLWQGGVLFQCTLLVVGFCIMWELTGFTPSDPGIRTAVSTIFATAIGVAFWLSWPLSVGIFAACLIGYLFLLKPSDKFFRSVFAAVSFLGLLTLAKLRLDIGLIETVWVIACVVASDVGGYFAGRTFGGPKLWPAVSPKKTWSGTIGGWVLAVVVTAVFVGFSDTFEAAQLLWAVVIAIFAQAGDLAESALKRRAGVKDSSNLIPGHGGFLDRFDGMLGAFLLVFIALIFGFQGWLF